MKKLIIMILLGWFGCSFLLIGETKPAKNSVGFGSAFIPAMKNGIYFEDPWNFWPNRAPSYMLQGSYARLITPSLRVGFYMEYERIRFTVDSSLLIRSFRRYNAGIDCIGQFPATPLHMQLGGYMGFGYLMANNWDNLAGIDFGLVAGPAWENEHIGVSAQVRSGFAPYSSSGTPKGVLLFNPKILLKIYYKF